MAEDTWTCAGCSHAPVCAYKAEVFAVLNSRNRPFGSELSVVKEAFDGVQAVVGMFCQHYEKLVAKEDGNDG